MSVVIVFLLCIISTSHFIEALPTTTKVPHREIIDYKLEFLNETINIFLDKSELNFLRTICDELQKILRKGHTAFLDLKFMNLPSSGRDDSQVITLQRSLEKLEDNIENDVNGSTMKRPSRKLLLKILPALIKIFSNATSTPSTSTTASTTLPTTTTFNWETIYPL